MSAISIGPEYWWREADYCRHVTVRGNTLRNNVLNGSDAGAVFIHGDGAMGNGDIAITDNRFDRNYGQIAVYAEDTDGLRIDGNRFVMPSQPLPDKTRTVLAFKASRNIALKGNTVEGLAKGDTRVRAEEKVEGLFGLNADGLR